MDADLVAQLRRARGKFLAMATAYALGAFNDNFFRQTANLLAVEAGREHLQGWFMAVFTAPYLLMAAPAGWLADRFVKRRVVIAAKALELAAMLVGAWGVLAMSWPLLGTMVCVMGLQSCLFSPSLNGSIPELYPALYVTRANSRLKVAVTSAILLGFILAGAALSRGGALAGVPVGRWLVAGVAVGVSTVGLLGSFFVPRRPAANPDAPFPWTGPLDTLRRLWHIARRDSLLATIIAANTFVWFAGSVLILVINVLAGRQLAGDGELASTIAAMGAGDVARGGKALGSYLNAAQLVGLAIGGLISGRLAVGPRWHKVLVPAAATMGGALVPLLAVPALPASLRIGVTFGLLTLAGLAGGIFMIPCEAFIQVRPAPGQRGATIASGNFAVFVGLIVSGVVANALNRLMPATASLACLGGLGILVAWLLHRRLRREHTPCSSES